MPFISPTLGVSTLNNGLIFSHLALDAGENSLGHAELVIVVPELLLLPGVGDEGGFNQNGQGIPSILVETAFISNPGEEQKLRNDDYQLGMAKGILAGIKRQVRKDKTVIQG